MAGRAGNVSVIERKRLGAAEELPVPIIDIARVVAIRGMERTGFATAVFMTDVAGTVDRVLEQKVFAGLPFFLGGNLCMTTAARFRFDVRVQEAERPGGGRKQDHDRQEDPYRRDVHDESSFLQYWLIIKIDHMILF